jgi:hypothetical protein
MTEQNTIFTELGHQVDRKALKMDHRQKLLGMTRKEDGLAAETSR